MVETAIDLVLAPLLLLTTVWCALVHQRLRRLRGDRMEIQDFILALGEATTRAEQVVAELREAASESHALLGDRHAAVRRERDELARLMESAGRVTRRLEAEIARSVRSLADGRGAPDGAASGQGRPAEQARASERPSAERRAPERAAPAWAGARPPPVDGGEVADLLASVPAAGGERADGADGSTEPDPARHSKRQRVGAELLRALQALR